MNELMCEHKGTVSYGFIHESVCRIRKENKQQGQMCLEVGADIWRRCREVPVTVEMGGGMTCLRPLGLLAQRK